ncbi:c6 zinc finger domain protein [Diplodia corticola]|uniref:C6 zinc finger domain protein n=1 Tax=Diplodia corticola TaxID=236234 RepID=A0A1J9RA24_9PEZI|nr:c6 zinc finger domain protein [Diplodia corticola]OJD37392.1 c6 zinc finger domain protein [Diplodia corticola]
MVGVPGRSKGCATCRRRKKGCDLQRPACGQCLKSGLQCGGYDRQRIFINHTAAQPSTLAAVAPPTRCSAVAPPVQSVEILLPDALTRTAYELKSLGLFWEAYLPQGMPFTAASAQLTTGAWLRIVDSIYHREPSLKHALLAMSLAVIGRQRDDAWMLSQGYASHGAALREMSQALQIPARAPRDELVAASKLMGLFEILFGADDKDDFAQARSWGSHVKGEQLLVAARGPHAHVHGNAHALFVDGRFNMMIQAARSRKKTMFSNPEWKEIPWQAIPKTPKDALLDIMVDIPTLMEKLNDLIEGDHDEDTKEILREALIRECWDADRRLSEWAVNMRLVLGLNLDRLVHVEKLGDLAAGQIVYIYWAACIMLFSTLQSANASSSRPDALPARTDPRVYARKIARSASYFFRPDAGIFGTHAASFPIGIALTVFSNAGSQDEEDRKLLTSIFNIPRVGVTIGKFLKSMRAGYDTNQRRFCGPVSF